MTPYNSDEVVEVNAVQWTGDNMDEIQEVIKTQSVHEGMTTGKVGDYIVEHPTGDLFICPQDEFAKGYELIDSDKD